jgi:putative transposase
MRAIWNLGLEQRLSRLSYPKDRKGRYMSFFDQCEELTALRQEVPYFDNLPRKFCDRVLKALDDAWKQVFKKTADPPKFKSKNRGDWAVLQVIQNFGVEDGKFYFPMSKRWGGAISINQHQVMVGKPVQATITKDIDQWYVTIVCDPKKAIEKNGTIESHDWTTVPSDTPVAIDRGVNLITADSDGRIVENPRFYKKSQHKLKHAQRSLSRKVKGSSNYKKQAIKVAKIHRKVRNQRKHFLHVESTRYAKNHSMVVLEDLNIKNMTKSAKGTVEKPGTNVAQKSGLNRSILDSGWGMFSTMLTYKCEQYGGKVVFVPPQYSSQTCSQCKYVDKGNRVSQSEFKCLSCGFVCNADVNAAKVLLSRGNHDVPSLDGVACGGSQELMKQESLQVGQANLF